MSAYKVANEETPVHLPQKYVFHGVGLPIASYNFGPLLDCL